LPENGLATEQQASGSLVVAGVGSRADSLIRGPVERLEPSKEISMQIRQALMDDALISMLDTSDHLWLVRGGSVGVVGMPGTLRAALYQAHQFSLYGGSPMAIVTPSNDEIEILPEQIHRLWKQVGLRVR
jgi:hypothetical protein